MYQCQGKLGQTKDFSNMSGVMHHPEHYYAVNHIAYLWNEKSPQVYSINNVKITCRWFL